jgi:mannose-binding lectin 2
MKLYELDLPETAQADTEDRARIEPSSSNFEPPRDHVEDPKPSSMSGVKMFFLLLFGVLACIACVIIGVIIYQKQQENSRKRFY